MRRGLPRWASRNILAFPETNENSNPLETTRQPPLCRHQGTIFFPWPLPTRMQLRNILRPTKHLRTPLQLRKLRNLLPTPKPKQTNKMAPMRPRTNVKALEPRCYFPLQKEADMARATHVKHLQTPLPAHTQSTPYPTKAAKEAPPGFIELRELSKPVILPPPPDAEAVQC